MVGPHAGEARLQLGDPVGQLDQLEILSLLLQAGCPQPKKIGHDAAESAQGHGGERHQGRGVVQRIGLADAGRLTQVAQGRIALCGQEQKSCGQQEQGQGEGAAHDDGLATSRRVNAAVASRARHPP